MKAYENPGSRAGPGNTVFTDLMGVDGVLVMTACQATELAQQDDNLGYGVFTYFLLSGLGGLGEVEKPAADTDQDGRVTVEELKSYLQREVPQYVSDVMHRTSPQNPLITGDEALSRVALSGYGVPLVGEVTAIDEERESSPWEAGTAFNQAIALRWCTCWNSPMARRWRSTARSSRCCTWSALTARCAA